MKKIILILFVFSLFCNLPVKAESFTWPTNGYIGWKYYTDTNGQEGIDGTYHTGIDIWGKSDGSWNNNEFGNSNAVYSTYQGNVAWVDESGLGLIIKHSDTLYTKYWHLRDRQVSTNNNVDTNTLLGYQDLAGNVVHLHLTVASSLLGNDASNTLDPSNYFGIQLDARNTNAVGWLHQIEHVVYVCPNTSNIFISNRSISGNVNCSASNSIVILPETSFLGEQHYFIQ